MKVKMYLLILTILAIVTHWPWFSNLAILTHGDWWFYNLETQKELLRLPTLWLDSSLGSFNISLSRYPVDLLWGGLAHIANFAVSERLIYLYPTLFLASLGSFFLIRKVLQSKIGAFLGSLVFTYNTYFFSGRTGHLTLMMAYALAPLALLFFVKSLEERTIKWSIVTGFLVWGVSVYEIRAFYIIAWLLLCYLMYFLFLDKKLSLRGKATVVSYATLPMLMVAFFSLFWILPLFKSQTLFANELLSRGLFGNEFLDITYAITLFHPFWGSPPNVFFTVQPIPLYFWAIPFFAFLGLLLNKKNQQVLFFGIISLLGILLTKQSAAPFSGLYLWLYNNLPGFNTFREASKFYFLITLGYSVLIGALVAWLWRNFTCTKVKTWGVRFLTFLVVGLFLFNSKNFVSGEVGTLFSPRSVPQDYLSLKDLISGQTEFFRTLWVPIDSRWGFTTYQNPRIDALFLKEIAKGIDGYQEVRSSTVGRKLVHLLQQNFANELLDNLSIRYIIVPLQDVKNEDDFFDNYGETRQFYIENLDKLAYLERARFDFESLAVFENTTFKPHIYLTNQPSRFLQDQEWQRVEFTTKNLTMYKLSLRNLSETVYLNFVENYHPGWKLRPGDFHWWQALVSGNYFLPEKNHYQTDTGLNYFRIDPQKIKNLDPQGESYIENPDGSIDFDLTLYFEPQVYIYLGLIISGATLLITLIILKIGRQWQWKR